MRLLKIRRSGKAAAMLRLGVLAILLMLLDRPPLNEQAGRWQDTGHPPAGAGDSMHQGVVSALVSRASSLAQGLDSPTTLRKLADYQMQQSEWRKARDTLERLSALRPEDAHVLYQLGLLWAPHDRVRAAEYFARVADDPVWGGRTQTVRNALLAYDAYARTDAHATLGVTLVGLGEWSCAEQALQMALETNAVNPTALAYLGFVRDQQGRDGLPDLEAALDMAPNDPVIYYLLGQHWRLVEDHRAALDAFSQAYWLSPDNPALAAEVGTSLRYLGELTEAERWLHVAVNLAPDDVRWYALLAAFYADTGFLLADAGLAFIEQASERAPYEASIRASLGWAYFQTGSLDKAREQLEIAVSINASDVRGRYYYGVVLENLGDRQGAIESYQVVVQQPGSEHLFGALAARAIQRLENAP